tara:strand:- start:5117 stop:5470 length:354 start_codon:yes stop_codon:yes gene_type:complete
LYEQECEDTGMIYAVSALLITNKGFELKQRLEDGSIAALRPDGREIVASMKRAKLGGDGVVRWTETCFCGAPLKHERETVLDSYFTDIETNEISEHSPVDGSPFLSYLDEVAAKHQP